MIQPVGTSLRRPACRLLVTCLGLLLLVVSPLAARQAAADPSNLLAMLKRGGHVLVFRHGATHADQADTDPLNLDNVRQQRQLNDQGRALARDIGARLRAHGIPFAEVHSSRFRRAVETAELMALGPVTPSLDLSEGGLVVSPNENARRATAFRALCARPLAAGANRLIVSHKPNIVDAFGKDWLDTQEGEASIFKIDGGSCWLVARIRADRWDERLR